jgi:hypothetical protein
MLGEDQPRQSVPFGKALHEPRAMLPGASGEIIRYAHVQRAIWSVRHDVYPSRHMDSFERTDNRGTAWMAGTTPAMNDKMAANSLTGVSR